MKIFRDFDFLPEFYSLLSSFINYLEYLKKGVWMKEFQLQEKFKKFIEDKGFKVIREFCNKPPDLIIERNGKKIAVEIKTLTNSSKFSTALGQLIFAKIHHKVDELWLVLPDRPSVFSREWVEVFLKLGIVIFCLDRDNTTFTTLDSLDSLKLDPRRLPFHHSVRRMQERIRKMERIIQERKEVDLLELSRILGVSLDTIRLHIRKGFPRVKGKMIIEGNKVRFIQTFSYSKQSKLLFAYP